MKKEKKKPENSKKKESTKVLICKKWGEVHFFDDDVKSECDSCHTAIGHRPDMNFVKKKICDTCAEKELDPSKSTIEIPDNILLEVAQRFGQDVSTPEKKEALRAQLIEMARAHFAKQKGGEIKDETGNGTYSVS